MRTLYAALALLLGLVTTLGIAEVLVRVLNPEPRIQIVRASPSLRLETIGDVPVWRPYDTFKHKLLAPTLRGCTPSATRHLVLTADSIFWVTDKRRIVDALHDQLGPDWCITDLSVPGYALAQQAAVWHQYLEEHGPPDAAVFGLWKTEGRFLRFPDVVYETSTVPIDPWGYPAAFMPVPAAVHHVLFRVSRLWEYMTITAADRLGEGAGYDGFASFTASVPEVPKLVISFSSLSRPFHETRDDVHHALTLHPHEHVIHAPRVFDDAGLEAASIRRDMCCHFNSEGHDALATAIVAWMRTELAPTAAP